VRHLLAFGSIGGRFGANGGSDYSLACDLLAKTVGRLRHDRPACAATCFHWHAWGDVGMMTRARGFGSRSVVRMMPVAEGIAHTLDELAAGLPESEVLVM